MSIRSRLYIPKYRSWRGSPDGRAGGARATTFPCVLATPDVRLRKPKRLPCPPKARRRPGPVNPGGLGCEGLPSTPDPSSTYRTKSEDRQDNFRTRAAPASLHARQRAAGAGERGWLLRTIGHYVKLHIVRRTRSSVLTHRGSTKNFTIEGAAPLSIPPPWREPRFRADRCARSVSGGQNATSRPFPACLSRPTAERVGYPLPKCGRWRRSPRGVCSRTRLRVVNAPA